MWVGVGVSGFGCGGCWCALFTHYISWVQFTLDHDDVKYFMVLFHLLCHLCSCHVLAFFFSVMFGSLGAKI